MIHYASFRYCGENYIAIGEQDHRLLVYVENYPGQYARHGGTLWPSWSKFMDGARSTTMRRARRAILRR